MQFVASTARGYKGTIGLAGLGLGTGPTGVVSKIRKASTMVNRLLDQYKCMGNVKVKFHFDLFGFSRGATCARVMAYLINSDPNTNKAYTGNDGIKNDGIIKKEDYFLLTSKEKEFLPIDSTRFHLLVSKTKTKPYPYSPIFLKTRSTKKKNPTKRIFPHYGVSLNRPFFQSAKLLVRLLIVQWEI